MRISAFLLQKNVLNILEKYFLDMYAFLCLKNFRLWYIFAIRPSILGAE